MESSVTLPDWWPEGSVTPPLKSSQGSYKFKAHESSSEFLLGWAFSKRTNPQVFLFVFMSHHIRSPAENNNKQKWVPHLCPLQDQSTTGRHHWRHQSVNFEETCRVFCRIPFGTELQQQIRRGTPEGPWHFVTQQISTNLGYLKWVLIEQVWRILFQLQKPLFPFFSIQSDYSMVTQELMWHQSSHKPTVMGGGGVEW